MLKSHQFICFTACRLLCTVLCLWAPQLWAQNFIEPSASVDADLIAESNIFVTMRDGVNISVDVYRPRGNGQYPTLYASAPYPHNTDNVPPNNALTGPVAWYVSQGYNYVIASTRGTGLSEGTYELLSRDEQQDHYELIEWIALQTWSNGKVAGVGGAYYGTAQWQMAIQNPPHLECIAPYNGVIQPYQDWSYPGGLASTHFTDDWYRQEIRLANAFPNTGPARIVNYDLDLQLLLHPQYDDYWRVRTSLENMDEISVPVFIMRSWDQNEPGLNGTFAALEQLNSVHKILISGFDQGKSTYQESEFLQEELLPFYDWCLNDGEGTSFIEQPRIRYYVRGQDQIKRENTWPPGNTEASALFLNRHSPDENNLAANDLATLNFSAITSSISISEYGAGTENTSISFISEILEQDMEITGPLHLELYASSSSTDTAFAVNLSEQIIFKQIAQNQAAPSFLLSETLPENNLQTATTTVLVSSGSQKASKRQATSSEPLVPGEVNRYDIALQPTAYRFKQGNRIILEIAKTGDGSLANKPSQDIIFHNRSYPSRLWLPLVQSVSSSATPADLGQGNAFPANIKASVPEFDFLNTNGLNEEIEDPVIFIRQ